jgi:hypothetical protein
MLALAIQLSSAAAADYQFPIEPKDTLAPLPGAPAMKVGPDAAPWIPDFIRLLRSRRPPSLHPISIALFHGDANTRYLAVSWGRARNAPSRIEFHKVVEGPDGRRQMHFMRALRDWSVSLEQPSGRILFPGEPTVAVVSKYGGANNVDGEELRLIQMELNTVDITPDWAGRVVDVADLDGDGKYEVVAMDSAWSHYFVGGAAAGPHLPVVLDRVNGRFIPACQKYAAIYRRWIDGYLDYANKGSEPAAYRAEALAGAYLATVQIAALDQARELYVRLVDVVRSDPSAMPTGVDVYQIGHDYHPLLVVARRFTKFGCVVGATGIGAAEAMDRFRMDRDGLRRLNAASEAP